MVHLQYISWILPPSLLAVCLHIFPASATECARLQIFISYHIIQPTGFICMHQPFPGHCFQEAPSTGLTRSTIGGCIHIFCASATGSARLWIFIAEQICRSGKWYVLRFGGGLLGAEAPLFCARIHIFTGNVQMCIFCLSGGFCFESVAHHQNSGKGSVDVNMSWLQQQLD